MPTTPTHRLKRGDRLNPDDRMLCEGGQYFLIYQGDGNLVIYDDWKKPPYPIWDTLSKCGVQLHRPGRVEMQPDGNVVMFDELGVQKWETGTGRPYCKGIFASLETNGSFVVYCMSFGRDSVLLLPIGGRSQRNLKTWLTGVLGW